MRYRYLAVVAVIALMLVGMPISADDNDEDETITVYGYVADISQSGNTPLPGVTVTLYEVAEGSQRQVSHTVTDSDGKFSLDISTQFVVFRLEFDITGYTVRTAPMGNQISENILEIWMRDILSISPDEEGYAISGGVDSLNPIAMAVTSDIVYGYVTGSDGISVFAVEGATVTLVSESDRSYTTTTDENGYFQIAVEYGKYTVTASCGGFTDSETYTVNSGQSVNIVLEEKESGLLFGIDTPHSLMVIGLILIGITLATLWTLHRKSKRPGSDINVVDDIDTLNEHEIKPGHP